LQRAGLIARGTRPIIDATSGVSGAGRTLSQKSLFCEVSLQPYNVLKHRHQPEIDAYAGVPTVFTPHLGAFERGILATIHVEVNPGTSAEAISRVLHDAYASEPFVRLCKPGIWPSVADVRHTNFCDIGWVLDAPHNHLILLSAIDNLVKGAAGQAVQCLNLALGLGETTGLTAKSTSPTTT
jgi:N-acetyl-gamma-glutamyl-phosphate reductase